MLKMNINNFFFNSKKKKIPFMDNLMLFQKKYIPPTFRDRVKIKDYEKQILKYLAKPIGQSEKI